MQRLLCVIAARGGSQGVPGKNIRPMLGKPLLARAVETARASGRVDRIIISTDSPDIARVGAAAGAAVPFMRPVELASSGAGKFQVWQHALAEAERIFGERYDLFVDLDCTNPLIEPADVAGAISRFGELRAAGKPVDAVFTVAPARRNPYFNLVEPDAAGALRMSKSAGPTVLARQNAPPVYEHVAGVYVLDANYLRRSQHLLEGHAEGYLIPDSKAFDVDTELDFALIEFLLQRRQGAG
jgi:CMP-N-acetylneuraminic acid synthetase